jgi:hypothetical protein
MRDEAICYNSATKEKNMKVLRICFVTAIVLACAVLAYGQKSQCVLKQAPQFRGFHLGMTTLDVRNMLEDATLFDLNAPRREPGSQAVRLSATELKEDIAEGIDEINLAFVDGKLATIKVTFNNVVTWDNAEDYFVKMSETLGLPKPVAANKTGDRGNEKYKIECTSFAVALAYSFGVSPNFTINDMAAQRVADERLSNEGDVRTINVTPRVTRRP